jgi:5'-3' exonuclease
LVGDAADGYPGIAGIGSVSAARILNRHGAIESFPAEVLGDRREAALLFKRLATLRDDAALFRDVDALRWHGPKAPFASWAKKMDAESLVARCEKLGARDGELTRSKEPLSR